MKKKKKKSKHLGFPKKKLCPNCGKKWNGTECDNCGFDTAFDPHWNKY